jgi:flagellar motor switch protein FliN/FliY
MTTDISTADVQEGAGVAPGPDAQLEAAIDDGPALDALPEPDDGVAAAHEFSPLPDGRPADGGSGLDLLHDVEMGVTAELGRARMLVKDVLALCPGSVIELDRTAGSPVDVLVNGTLIARGEVVVIDEEFGIRVTEVIGYSDETRR